MSTLIVALLAHLYLAVLIAADPKPQTTPSK
jgi:hypothetical protein